MTDCRFRRPSCPAAGSDNRLPDAAAVAGTSTSPTRYTAELAERILQELLTGRSLRHVCKNDGFPPESTVRTWVAKDRDGFAVRYGQARKLGHKALADRQGEILDRVLEELASGRTMRDVCRDDGMPAPSTVMAWVAEDRERYDLARKLRHDAMAEEIREITDSSRNDRKRKPGATERHATAKTSHATGSGSARGDG